MGNIQIYIQNITIEFINYKHLKECSLNPMFSMEKFTSVAEPNFNSFSVFMGISSTFKDSQVIFIFCKTWKLGLPCRLASKGVSTYILLTSFPHNTPINFFYIERNKFNVKKLLWLSGRFSLMKIMRVMLKILIWGRWNA